MPESVEAALMEVTSATLFQENLLEAQITNFRPGGSGCGTAVEHTPRDKEVVGSNHAGLQLFFFSSLLYTISSVSLIRSFMEVQHY